MDFQVHELSLLDTILHLPSPFSTNKGCAAVYNCSGPTHPSWYLCSVMVCSACVPAHFSICGQRLPLVDSVVHLGNILQYDLSDKLDVQSKLMTFIHQANSVLFQCNGCKLFKAYCFSLYGCALWRLNAHDLHSLNVSFNNVIRQIWKLPYNCHASIAHPVGLTTSIYNIIDIRFIRLLSIALSHPSVSFILYFMTAL